ncbi:DUF3179 domain-containing (seleno)protein [Halobellus sp. GM3]|uniref:DUF3179 domain-containing (seleno)protein n=1 Tax=Halobellus sp. GM3 TaxID=3458410 RepID=UPI00403D6B94
MRRSVTRRAVLAGVGAAALSGCVGGGPAPGSEAATEDDTASNSPRSATAADRGQTGPPTRSDRLPLPADPPSLRDQSVSGGPPKDGIPSIDDPRFVPPDVAAERLDPGDPVFGLATGAETKAYPQSILVHHEICNDVVDGTPVSVTYCPLTGTAMGFERGETTFGVSGRLVNNNLIMYDRSTETWWSQVLATAMPGAWNEDPPIRSLREFRVVWTTWERWSNRHPETRVLSRETGFAKNYDRDPYGAYNPRRGYYDPGSPPMFPALSEDEQLRPKAVVLGARTPEGAVAFSKDELRDAGVLSGTLGETPVIAAYDSALDTGYVFENPDQRAFEYRDDQVVADTGEVHRPDALPLDRTLAFDAMWFAWSGFYPDTRLYA